MQFFGKKDHHEDKQPNKPLAPYMYAFGCYDYDRVVAMSLVKPDAYSKEWICQNALPRALPQRMPVPPEAVVMLSQNLEYFEPKEWGAPYVKLNPAKSEGFDVDEDLVQTGIKNYLEKLGYSQAAIDLAHEMQITVPFPAIGLYVVVVILQK